MIDWNEARVDLLKRLHADHLSAHRIALEMGDGVSRNAVIGKINRLGLAPKRNTRVNNPLGMKARAGLSPRRIVKPRPLIEDRTVEAIQAEAPPAAFLAIPFDKIEPQHCRYPRGSGNALLFCGQPKAKDSSYCAACHARCYAKPREQAPMPFWEHKRGRRAA